MEYQASNEYTAKKMVAIRDALSSMRVALVEGEEQQNIYKNAVENIDKNCNR